MDKKLQLINDLWNFIENDFSTTGEETNAKFFELRERVRNIRTTPAKKTKSGIVCTPLPNGRYLWDCPNGKQFTASFPHDEKAYKKIINRVNAGIRANLRKPQRVRRG